MSNITVTLCFICKKEKEQRQKKKIKIKFYFTEILFSQNCVVCESVKICTKMFRHNSDA